MPLELCGYYFDDTQIHYSLLKSQFLLAKSPCFTSFACIHHCLQPLQQKEYTTNMAKSCQIAILISESILKTAHFSTLFIFSQVFCCHFPSLSPGLLRPGAAAPGPAPPHGARRGRLRRAARGSALWPLGGGAAAVGSERGGGWQRQWLDL